jgi:hypothetical protein
LLVGGFAISAFILSSISFVHTAQTRVLTVPVALHLFFSLPPLRLLFRIHSSAAALSVTTFQLVRGSFGIGSAASISSSVGGGGVNSVQPPPRPIPHLSISVQVVVLHLAVASSSIPAHLVPAFLWRFYV